ncbi:hypothetical protein Nepgr_021706 [Nepenthes gracilis]|uniref:Uncharacterized protein n=1 Tax=Nepenthes gracilis TaxID=150966 RepID=A0AAD3SXY3_NEPGR|nr:hypothetical protein Nepgr_021706 [Nepenthes gracilis]
MVNVEYSWKPIRCGQCLLFGHEEPNCKAKRSRPFAGKSPRKRALPKSCPQPSAFSVGLHKEVGFPGNSFAPLLSNCHPDVVKVHVVKDLVVQCPQFAEQIVAENLEGAPASRPPPPAAVSLSLVDAGCVVSSQVGVHPNEASGEPLIGRSDLGSKPGAALMDCEGSLSPCDQDDDPLQVGHHRAACLHERKPTSFAVALRHGLASNGEGHLGIFQDGVLVRGSEYGCADFPVDEAGFISNSDHLDELDPDSLLPLHQGGNQVINRGVVGRFPVSYADVLKRGFGNSSAISAQPPPLVSPRPLKDITVLETFCGDPKSNIPGRTAGSLLRGGSS